MLNSYLFVQLTEQSCDKHTHTDAHTQLPMHADTHTRTEMM